MGAAIQRADGTYRAWDLSGVNPTLALASGEHWVTLAAMPVVTTSTPAIDIPGFITAFLNDLGKVKYRLLLAKYPEIPPAILMAAWPVLQTALIDAHAALDITDADYAQVKALAATYGIQVTL